MAGARVVEVETMHAVQLLVAVAAGLARGAVAVGKQTAVWIVVVGLYERTTGVEHGTVAAQMISHRVGLLDRPLEEHASRQ